MIETWKNVEGYEGIYLISNIGRIKSLDKQVRYGRGIRTVKGRILKATLDTKGYYKLTLCDKNANQKTARMHRLIARAFIPNPHNEEIVNHLNGIKTDNRIENLEWCSFQENCQHAQDNGLNLARYSQKQREAVRRTGLANKKKGLVKW